MGALLQDVRFAVRTLGRSRGFAALAVLTLGLGIGVNTAIFSVVNVLLFRPLPFEDPDRLLHLYGVQGRTGWEQDGFSAADLADIRAGTTTLAAVGAVGVGGYNITGDHEPVRASGATVTADVFPTLGVAPQLGRGFVAAENEPDGERVVILGDAFWQRHLGGRPDVIGRTITVNGAPSTVVGVMPPRFGFPERAELWLPARPDPAAPRTARQFKLVARLHPDATLTQANAELARISGQLAAAYPESNVDLSFAARAYRDAFTRGEQVAMLYLLLGAVGFVLLIACGNVANLLLARASARRQEIGIRTALGAGRGRLVRQLLTESLAISLMGGALGVLVAELWLRWMLARVDGVLVYWMDFSIDARVLAYTACLAILTGLVFGTVPALRATRTDVVDTLRDGGRGRTGGIRSSRLGRALVVGEIALSIVLLVGASLAIRSFLATVRADPGLDGERVLTMRTSLTGERYDGTSDRAETFLRFLERVRGLPGVEGAAFTTALPAGDLGSGVAVEPEGFPLAESERPRARSVAVTPDYWEMLRRPLLSGRTFTEQETIDSASAVVIVSQELAAQLWPGQAAEGRRLRRIADGEAGPWLTVIGVSPTLPYARPGQGGGQWDRQLHVPYAADGWRLMTLAVRTVGDPAGLTPLIREELRAVDPSLPLFSVWTLDRYQASTITDRRTFGEVFGAFALLALVLAAVGVYGVVAFTVGQRTREFGIRKALGARDVAVTRLVLREGLVLVAAGIGLGMLGAFAVARLMRGMLHGIVPTDPLTFIGVPLLLAAVALVACYLPARRATRVDPTVALRAE